MKQHSHRAPNWRHRTAQRLGILMLLIFMDGHALVADTYSERRIAVGLNLFGALLVADRQAETKVNAGGRLPVYVLYVEDHRAAQEYATNLQAELPRIRTRQTRITSIALKDYLAGSQDLPLGIFISQRLTDEELSKLTGTAIDQSVILFSPFEGDVEKGVMAGLSIQASVRPLVNLPVLRATGADIKPFYLKVAKTYE
jgi:hypothetical protein